MRFPGVGVKTSAAFAAAVDEVGRFRQSRTAGAYFWLIPKPSSVQGNRLDQPHHQTRRQYGAQVALRSRNSFLTRSRGSFALKRWAIKIARRRRLRKARVALARRLTVVMHAMLRDGTLFEA